MGNRTPFVLPSHKLYPRSVHTHFQGSCVVFGLLIYIAVGCLTEHLCSHLLWLCNSAESDLVKPLSDFAFLIYTYIISYLSAKVKFYFMGKLHKVYVPFLCNLHNAPGRDPAWLGRGILHPLCQPSYKVCGLVRYSHFNFTAILFAVAFHFSEAV